MACAEGRRVVVGGSEWWGGSEPSLLRAAEVWAPLQGRKSGLVSLLWPLKPMLHSSPPGRGSLGMPHHLTAIQFL